MEKEQKKHNEAQERTDFFARDYQERKKFARD